MSSIPSPKHPDDPADPMRSAVRFPLHLPVRVEMEGEWLYAVTEDISATGVMFVMPVAPVINTRLTWALCMPADVMGGKEDVTVNCVGRVVWHGPATEGCQVGVVIDSYRIGDRPNE